jgi:hypothetical protein
MLQREENIIAAEVGARHRHRFKCVYARTAAACRKLFWFGFELDGSFSFGFSDPCLTPVSDGQAVATIDGQLLPVTKSEIRLTGRAARSARVTLHASGKCRVRCETKSGRLDVLEMDSRNWLPITNPMEWLHAYTIPVKGLPLESKPKRDSFVVQLESEEESLYCPICFFPARLPLYPRHPKAVSTFFGRCPLYVVRIPVLLHQPTACCLFLPGGRGDK